MDERTTPPDGPTPPPSLAADLIRRGQLGISRSFRFHRPRGAFCGAGYCQQCPVRAGGGHGLACELGPGEGRARRLDPLRAVGARGERLTPWFYERRFGHPRILRQTYLRVLRYLSAAPPLAPVPAHGAAALRQLETDVLVVGGGLAGIAAAARIAADGAEVLLVEREAELGGAARFVPSRRRALARQLKALGSSDAILMTGATCVGLYEEEGVAALVDAESPATVRFHRLVVATGAYDRLLGYPGNDLPGTIGLRAFERYLGQGAFRPGVRIGVFAAPEEAARALGAAAEAGGGVAFVACPAELPEAGATYFPAETLVGAGGRGRVRSAELSGAGSLPCDILVLGFTQPTFELQVQAGCAPALRGSPGIVVPEREPALPLLVVGEAAGWLDPGRIADEAAGAAGAWAAGDPAPAPASPRRLPPPARRSPDAFVCLCEDVRVRDVALAVDEGFGDAELIKRRTGATTGPCQGKLCLAELAEVLGELGVEPALPTVRPPTRPVPLARLGAP